MVEIWTAIAGTNGRYGVSTAGRVRGPRRMLSLMTDKDGYRYVDISAPGPPRTVSRRRVHRLVCEAFLGEPPQGAVTNHIDRNPANNDVSNLEWCTQEENVRHSVALGSRAHLRGERVPTSKLTEQDVLRIKRLLSCGEMSHQAIADHYGVRREAVTRINLGKNWGWLSGDKQ